MNLLAWMFPVYFAKSVEPPQPTPESIAAEDLQRTRFEILDAEKEHEQTFHKLVMLRAREARLMGKRPSPTLAAVQTGRASWHSEN